MQYQEHVGTRYPFNGGKDAKILKELREIYSDEDLQIFMVAFFEIEDGFIEDSGYGLGVFRGCLPKVIQFVQRQQQPASGRRGRAPAHEDFICPHVEEHSSKWRCDQATKLQRPRKVAAS